MFPQNIYIIGGGRWARVLTGVIAKFVPKDVCISIISNHFSEQVNLWILENRFEQEIKVFQKWPEIDAKRSNVAIIVNAARDHFNSVKKALSLGIPVFVEKPFALSLNECQLLINAARKQNIPIGLSQIFLYTRYFEKFKNVVSKAGKIKSMRVNWSDPKNEFLYGEKKTFDPGLPIHQDLLPHILPLVTQLTSNSSLCYSDLSFYQAGSHLIINLLNGDISCKIEMIRNGDKRERMIAVETDLEFLKLDFSSEPGKILCRNEYINGDPDWSEKPKPIETMLSHFFNWIHSPFYDPRLDIESSVQIYAFIEQINTIYSQKQKIWLADKLKNADVHFDENLNYLCCEIFQKQGFLSKAVLDKKIEECKRIMHEKMPDRIDKLQELMN